MEGQSNECFARQTHERRERARLVHWIITRFPFEEDKEISGNRVSSHWETVVEALHRNASKIETVSH